jgi:transcriptional regulator with XRE-family HTH domain
MRDDLRRRQLLGQAIRKFRERRGLSQKDVVVALGRDPDDTRSLRRYENGDRLPPRETLLAILTAEGKGTNTEEILDLLNLAGYDPPQSADEMQRYKLLPMPIAEPQKTRWGPADGKPAGISIINDPEELFIPWIDLEIEIEQKLLCQLGRHIRIGCKVRIDDFHGRQNWLLRVVTPDPPKNIGYVWFGPDPEKNWAFDGLVRVGDAPNDYEAEVWQVFQRYSDGSYRRIEAKLPKSA